MALQEILMEEYILTHGELAKQPDRSSVGGTGETNLFYFRKDFVEGRLDRYKGTFVAYQTGILTGQSKDRDKIYDTARKYYGDTGLTVFKVPASAGLIDTANREMCLGNSPYFDKKILY